MRLNSTDELYIHAPPQAVYAAIIRLSEDAGWWPGATSGGGYGWVWVRAPASRWRRIRFKATIPVARDGEGISWLLEEGDLRGRAEWWLEPFKDGTIVHYFLDVDPAGRPGRPAARLRRHRFALRRGLNALKDALERDAAVSRSSGERGPTAAR